jgi:glutathione S-transferase
MYQIHGLDVSTNTIKTLYVAEALGIDYEYISVDLTKGENKTPEHLKRHPLGKLPTLTHDEKTLFESNVICTYLASVENSKFYPQDNFARAQVDQWLAFFTNHIGRWITTYVFEAVFKEKFGLGEPSQAVQDEAVGFIQQQLPCIEDQIIKHRFLTGTKSVADYVAYAYFELTELVNYPLNESPALYQWYTSIKAETAIQRAQKKLGIN